MIHRGDDELLELKFCFIVPSTTSCIFPGALKGVVKGLLHRGTEIRVMSYIIRILIGKSLLCRMTQNIFVQHKPVKKIQVFRKPLWDEQEIIKQKIQSLVVFAVLYSSCNLIPAKSRMWFSNSKVISCRLIITSVYKMWDASLHSISALIFQELIQAAIHRNDNVSLNLQCLEMRLGRGPQAGITPLMVLKDSLSTERI